MDTESLKYALREAEEAASAVSERFQVAAFIVSAHRLLRDSGRAEREPEMAGGGSSGEAVLPATITELFALSDGKGHADRVEALADFSLHREGVDGISTDYITEGYSQGRIPNPANIPDVLAKSGRRGHLMSGERRDGKKTWRLTATGEKYIEALLEEAANE